MSKRPIEPMPEDIQAEITRAGLAAAYEQRPFYQRNDYLRWIGQAARPETRTKRIGQMLDELRTGGVYMGMDHAPSRRDGNGS